MFNKIKLEQYLATYFNHDEFRTGQREIIEDVLKGKDVLGILPTGTGKSVCYQLPAQLLEGITIVVSPLVSLMLDQVKELKALQYKGVVAINSFIDYPTRKRIFEQLNTYKLVFVSPELLQQKEVIRLFKNVLISLFVIDEAHCISQWGHDFRPDYLRLDHVIKEFNNPPILALSATATPKVRNEIIKSLGREEMIEHIFPMDRENIAFYISEAQNDHEKLELMLQWLNQYNVPTIVYFQSRKTSMDIADKLRHALPNKKIAYYHAGMDQQDRIMVQQQFMNDQLDIICCTSAFGMGINKQNIRLVIHYHPSKDIESYIQEVGRAGRDGNSSVGLILYNNLDEERAHAYLQQERISEVELRIIFDMLFQLHNSKESIYDDVKTANLFQLNELQWGFLYYQFEKHGIIDKNEIIYNKQDWQPVMSIILDEINMRMAYKNNQLANIWQWIRESKCLRENLYIHFQNSLKPVKFNCCKNCGFTFDDWQPETMSLCRNSDAKSWKERLKNILIIE